MTLGDFLFFLFLIGTAGTSGYFIGHVHGQCEALRKECKRMEVEDDHGS